MKKLFFLLFIFSESFYALETRENCCHKASLQMEKCAVYCTIFMIEFARNPLGGSDTISKVKRLFGNISWDH